MRPPTSLPLHVLHSHSVYSVLDGASTVDEYISYVKTHGLGACGLCDHGFALGLHELITKCNKADVTPIPGVEFYLQPRDGYVFNQNEKPYEFGHLTLWAMNQQGYSNLIALATRSWMPGRVVKRWGKPKPRITWDDLALYNEDLICGSGCIEGPIAKPLLRGEADEAVLNANVLNEMFGDRLYFEVMPHAVNRDYCKDRVVCVKDERGNEYTFLPTDMVDTPEGRMTVDEAREKRVNEIWAPFPARFQERPILDPDCESERQLDITDLSVLTGTCEPEEVDLDDVVPRTRNMPQHQENHENQSTNLDSEREDVRRHRVLV